MRKNIVNTNSVNNNRCQLWIPGLGIEIISISVDLISPSRNVCTTCLIFPAIKINKKEIDRELGKQTGEKEYITTLHWCTQFVSASTQRAYLCLRHIVKIFLKLLKHYVKLLKNVSLIVFGALREHWWVFR